MQPTIHQRRVLFLDYLSMCDKTSLNNTRPFYLVTSAGQNGRYANSYFTSCTVDQAALGKCPDSVIGSDYLYLTSKNLDRVKIEGEISADSHKLCFIKIEGGISTDSHKLCFS